MTRFFNLAAAGLSYHLNDNYRLPKNRRWSPLRIFPKMNSDPSDFPHQLLVRAIDETNNDGKNVIDRI